MQLHTEYGATSFIHYMELLASAILAPSEPQCHFPLSDKYLHLFSASRKDSDLLRRLPLIATAIGEKQHDPLPWAWQLNSMSA